MTWDELTAIGSCASAIVLAIASIAAILQLRHVRQSNQLLGFLTLYEKTISPGMDAAISYVRSRDFSGDDAINTAMNDPQVRMAGNHMQEICQLVRLGWLPPRLMVSLLVVAWRLWEKLEPVVMAYRASSGVPVWGDMEYCATTYTPDVITDLYLRDFPVEMRERLRKSGGSPPSTAQPTATN
jgi:hypothetical protein